MKQLRIILIFITMALMPYIGMAKEEYAVTKEKKVSGHYTVGPNDKLDIDNTYGMIHVNTWNKNEVTIDVIVTAKANTEQKANGVLDRIDVTDMTASRGKVSYKTSVRSPTGNNENTRFTIDYTIYAPKRIAMDLINKYGNIYIDDCEGPLKIRLSYGNLSTKNIGSTTNDIEMRYSNGTIASIQGGDLEFTYANVTIDKAKELVMKNKYGKLNIDDIGKLRIGQRYGDLEIGSVGSISGSLEYAGMDIGALGSDAELTMRYCSKGEIRSVKAGVNKIKIDASYSSVHLHPEKGLNMSVTVDAQYGNVEDQLPSRMLELNESRRPAGASYTGTVGSGGKPMEINIKYGNLIFK